MNRQHPSQSSALADHGHPRALPNSVDTAAIQDDAVTAAKIVANAVGASELADNAVDTNAIADNAVTLAKMADNSVGTTELVDDSVTAPKINVPSCRAVWSANTSVPSNIATVTAIAFGGTDAHDTNSMHDPSTNNTRITMPVAGVYSVGGWYQMAADANNSGFRGIYLRVNGTTFIDQDEVVTAAFGGAGRDVRSIGDTDYKFAANDYVELVARQVNTSPGPPALNVTGGAFWATYKTKG